MCAKSNFFDFRENLLRKPDVAPAGGGREPVSVAQLTADIERSIKSGLPTSVAVKGELSNYNAHRGSGHHYFTMKDAGACIDCVMFKSDAMRLKFEPTDGMEIVATGRVGIYAQRGRYQLYATSLQPIGQGALEIAFQQMRAKLEAAGLFAVERKRELPTYPRRIVLITSSNTAALQDMLKVLRRFRFLRLSLYHVPVQGTGCGDKIAEAIRHVSSTLGPGTNDPADVVIVSRGGGSLEDLWGFNEEAVARAIAASTIPVVTGIGHQVDVSIADLVADYHAHTPTEAATVVTRYWLTAGDEMVSSTARLLRAIVNKVAESKSTLTAFERHEFFRRPTDRINRMRQQLDDVERQLHIGVERRSHSRRRDLDSLAARLQRHDPRHMVDLRKQRLSHVDNRLMRETRNVITRHADRLSGMEGRLVALSPEAVLHRGYSITRRAKDGAIVRSATQLSEGETIITRFSDSEVKSTVEDEQQMKLFE